MLQAGLSRRPAAITQPSSRWLPPLFQAHKGKEQFQCFGCQTDSGELEMEPRFEPVLSILGYFKSRLSDDECFCCSFLCSWIYEDMDV